MSELDELAVGPDGCALNFECDPSNWPGVSPCSTPSWVARDGKVIQISQMEDLHLVNAIAHCARGKLGIRHAAMSALVSELQKRIQSL